MSRTTTLIVGCGYLGRRVGRLLRDRGERVFGTSRKPERSPELASWGIEAVLADVLEPGSLDGLPQADRTLYCVGFDRTLGVPIRTVYVDGLRHALGRLMDRTGKLVYAGSTGVYGQDDGDWVDEKSAVDPRTESGRSCLEAESVVRSYEKSGLPSTILRFSGLYGPGRIMRREGLLRGEPILGDPDKWLNLIHIQDAANATVAALDRGLPGSLYIVSDDRPVPRSEFYALAAESLQAQAPRFELPRPGSPEARREESNKRVSNRRMRDALGVNLTYPDITTGVPAAIAAEGSH
ncbi:SDR family oxidoreductase [Tundrisphaera lichenicola]|uniref:SDR family oxidoreductase n=1 Tax=Tundrisphaera lichenicola TaxID=2029860 RepID=UPI003EBC8AEF